MVVHIFGKKNLGEEVECWISQANRTISAACAAAAASHHIATTAPSLLSNKGTELRSFQVKHLKKSHHSQQAEAASHARNVIKVMSLCAKMTRKKSQFGPAASPA